MKLSIQGSRIIFKNGKIIRLKPSAILYKEDTQENTSYLILYGKISIWTMNDGILAIISKDESIGEESFLMKNYRTR